jgi:hypothetical protein
MLLAPGEELGDGVGIASPRVLVPDARREEFDEAPGGGFTGTPTDGRKVFNACTGKVAWWDWHEAGVHRSRNVKSRRRMPNSSGS